MAVDPAGILELPADGQSDVRLALLADTLRLPINVVTVALPKLCRRVAAKGVTWVEVHPQYLVLPWFLESQKTRQTDKARKQRSREQTLAMARAGVLNDRRDDVMPSDRRVMPGDRRDEPVDPTVDRSNDVTSGDLPVTPGDPPVTPGDRLSPGGPDPSPMVTDGHSWSLREENRGDQTRGDQRDLMSTGFGSSSSGPDPGVVATAIGSRGTPAVSTQFDFELPYRDYPRKQGKKGGMDMLKEWVKDGTFGAREYELFCAATRKMGEVWAGHSNKFCPMFSTFVDKEYWREEDLPSPDPDDGAKKNFAAAPDRDSFRDAAADDIDFKGRG
jgi:hypothetical protein